MGAIYQKSIDEVLNILKVDKLGLNDEEVKSRRNEFGYNELEEGAKKSVFRVFLEQFNDFLVIILIAAALISAFLGKLESALVIFVVIIINAVLGTIQHVKAEQSLKGLKALSSPTAKVLRNGQKVEIPSRELMVGDILYLDAGDYVSADCRVMESFSLQANESSLTGESVSVLKESDVIIEDNVAIGDTKNMVFSGSFITYGRATCVVTSIGMNTEIGKIASLLDNAKEKKTPLQISMDNFGRRLSIIIIGICLFIFLLNIFRGDALINAFMFAVALAVAAIPEALGSIVTIVLAIGTQKMAKENAIVRNLHAVESLGSVSVICSDKTGTLTQNKMTVKKVFVDDKVLDFDALNQADQQEKKLVLMALLCNDAVTIDDKEIGDPTEVALVDLGSVYHIDELDIRKEYPRLGEIPFDSNRKLMSTVHKFDGKPVMATKGAPDVILSRSVSVEKENGLEPMTPKYKNKILDINEDFSRSGLRVLAFAYKDVKADSNIILEDENNLVFLGLIAMMDPPRVESPAAVASCMKAGIKPVMITGDHKITAAAIAKEIGILKDESEAIEGNKLDKWDDATLKEKVDNISVYARVSPEHKIRIVKAWQDKGNIVAMTGDGVNDAPALKQADIGVAMGITGTEVAKDAASMVLADDNFSTIIKAIANGRSIYANIKNSIKFLLSGNTAGILSVLYASVLALPVPFAPIHLLFINLVTDSLPAIAIGLEPHNKGVMDEKPRNTKVPILNKSFNIEILIEGFLIALSTMIAFHIGLSMGNDITARTMAFATLCLSRLLHGFNCRSRHSIIKIGIFSNKHVWYALGIGYILLMSVLQLRPLAGILEVASLSFDEYKVIYGLSIIPFLLVQGYKLLFIRN